MIYSRHSRRVSSPVFASFHPLPKCNTSTDKGTAVSWNSHFKSQTEGEVFAAVIDLVLNCACFIYIGAWLPFVQFNIPELGILPWKLVVLCIGILILRRIPCLLLIYKRVPDLKNWKEALFCGHFGEAQSTPHEPLSVLILLEQVLWVLAQSLFRHLRYRHYLSRHTLPSLKRTGWH